MHNSFILQQYVCYTTILNMFRAARRSSSGGQIISPQPLVSSPSVNSRAVCRWRADCSPLGKKVGNGLYSVGYASLYSGKVQSTKYKVQSHSSVKCDITSSELFQITNLMHNSFILQQYVCYTTILNMF